MRLLSNIFTPAAISVPCIMQSFHYYYDQIEQHLPFKPSKWDRKYKIALVCLGGVFFTMAIVAFALHDRVPKPLISNTDIRL